MITHLYTNQENCSFNIYPYMCNSHQAVDSKLCICSAATTGRGRRLGGERLYDDYDDCDDDDDDV